MATYSITKMDTALLDEQIQYLTFLYTTATSNRVRARLATKIKHLSAWRRAKD